MGAQELHSDREPSLPQRTRKGGWLLCRQTGWRVALPVSQVIETMRPLPLEAVSGMPSFVLGLAIVRGAPVPAVDVGILLGRDRQPARRWVTVRAGERCVALAVESVEGVRDLPESSFDAVPPLLRAASENVVAAIGTLDVQLLVALEGTRLFTDQQWLALAAQARPR